MKTINNCAHKSLLKQTKNHVGGLLLMLSLATPLAAQTVSPSTSSDPITSPSIAAPSGTYSSPALPIAPTSSPSDGAFAVGGHLPVLISATVAEVYDDNIYIQPQKTSDFITELSLVLDYRTGNDTAVDGNYFDVYYAPSGDIYSKGSAPDSFNQKAGAFYQHRFAKLALGIEQTYSRESATGAALGNLVTTSTYLTKATAKYYYSDKLYIDGAFTQNITNIETGGYSNSNEWTGEAYFLYKFDSKLSAGAGAKIGWLDVGLAPNQTYQQYLARVDYHYSGKLLFELFAGLEDRQYQGPNTGDKIAPVFSLSTTYTPFINTAITFSGGRGYNPSYNLYGQDYIATHVSLIGRQRFCDSFYYNLGLGYENDTYEGAGINIVGPSRHDNYYYATTGFDWVPNSWLKGSIFYKYQRDDSNFTSYAFSDNQVGVSTSFSY